MSWPDRTLPFVYYLDPNKGLFRSSDRGETWTKIWATSANFVAGDPTRPGTIYVSAARRALFRIDDARVGVVGQGITPARLSRPAPGPVAVGSDGTVYLARTGSPPTLSRSLDLGSSWQQISNAFYEGAALFPKDLTVSPDDFIYVALRHNGVVVGTPLP
jgi:hypothetical protein